jgi:hypothetical protein
MRFHTLVSNSSPERRVQRRSTRIARNPVTGTTVLILREEFR